MNKNVKQLWIKALKTEPKFSGKMGQYINQILGLTPTGYIQGRTSMLRKDDTYSSYGVLCDIHSRIFNVKWELKNNVYTYIGNTCSIPKDVMAWAELDMGIYKLTKDFERSFKQIAEDIENKL